MSSPENRVVMVPPDQAGGLVELVPRSKIRMLHIMDIELSQYVNLAQRTTDAKAFCIAAATFAASMIAAIAVGPTSGVSTLVALLAVSVCFAFWYGVAWRREHVAATLALAKLQQAVDP